MKLTDIKLILICLIGAVLVAGSVCGMTIQLGSAGAELIAPGDTWKFFRGTDAVSDPADAWKETSFDDSSWETGDSGFGYGDGDDATILNRSGCATFDEETAFNNQIRCLLGCIIVTLCLNQVSS